jgi:DNA-binding NarL/FixJ family response regulator
LCTLLDSQPDITVVGTADSGVQAIVLARTHLPDVILTGLRLHNLDGLKMIERLTKEPLDPQPKFVVFTMNDSDEVIDDILRAEVSGLLVKEATREELSSAVRAAARGHMVLAPQITQRLVDWYRRRGHRPGGDGLTPAITSLTPRERQVLMLLADGKGSDEIASELSIGVTTVRTHFYRLRTKLNLRDRAQLVSFAYRAGLVESA